MKNDKLAQETGASPDSAAARPSAPLKQYTAPVLTRYGEVAQLTRGGASSATSDAGANMMRDS